MRPGASVRDGHNSTVLCGRLIRPKCAGMTGVAEPDSIVVSCSEMKKPYVVAHVLSSIDGRIVVHNWPPLNSSDIFERTAETIKSDAWIVGRTTMQEFSSRKSHKLGKPDPSIRKEDFVGAHSARTY